MDPELDLPAADDPLVSLGLVDPKTGGVTDLGRTTMPANSRTPTITAGSDDDGTTPPAGQQPPAGQPSAGTAGTAGQGPDWDSDDNPYKKQFRELSARLTPADPGAEAAKQLESRTQAINGQAEAAYHILITQGTDGQNPMAAPQARLLVDSLKTAAIAEAQREADRAALSPVAKRMVAERIAAEFSTDAAKIEVDELISLNSVDAMKAKAETLRDVRRQTAFTVRKQSGTDTVEHGAPAGRISTEAIESLSPAQKIAFGLRRGD